MRGDHSGSGRSRQPHEQHEQHDQHNQHNQQSQQEQHDRPLQYGNQGRIQHAQGDGSEADDRQERVRQRSNSSGSGSQGSTGMGAFGDGDFQGGTGGMHQRGRPGYGQDGNLRGGYGQGSGYAQSSEGGGYGQGAEQQGGRSRSGSDQHSDERFGQHGGQGQQRSSPYGYGGPGAQQQAGPQSGGGAGHQGGAQRGQHYGKGPKGYQRSDDRIREDVSEHRYHDGDVDASEIEIDVTGGEVTLTGTVSSRAEKRRAEDVAEQCSGVRDVQNRLRVQSGNASPSAQVRGAQQEGAPRPTSGAMHHAPQQASEAVRTGG